MQTREEFEKVMSTLQQDALERKLAEPAVSFALHAVACHADMLAVLKALVADIREYERINNLAPSPGKRDCWQSVTWADAVIAKAEGVS